VSGLLAIETSSEACSVALLLGDRLEERFECAPMGHAEILLPAVRSLMSDAGIHLGQLDAIAFGRGPGSFTSLRIGIGVVQGLAWGAQLPVVPVPSLAAVALEAAAAAGAEATRIRVAMDARMQEVYTADYRREADGGLGVLVPERVCSPGDASDPPGEPFLAAGNGFERFPELERLGASARYCAADTWPRAARVAELARLWLQHNEPLPAEAAQPVYLRDKVAEKAAPR
jgi:tRNA threonylcarbamoyladenosine biosynthesis protein TsaB